MLPTTYAWVLNLDADLELAKPSYNPSARLTEQLATYGSDATALIGPRGHLVSSLPKQPPENCLGRAWCPTPRALAIMRAAHVRPERHPDVKVLRQVNHREFAYALRRGLPEQAVVHDESSLYTILANTKHPWLLKRPLAFAGRGQQRVLGEVESQARAWIAASLRNDVLIVEPLVAPLAEFSLHGFVWPDGRHQVGRVCAQTVSDRGVFRAVELAPRDKLSTAERGALEDAAHAAAQALFQAGYFGPFGIDAYRYKSLGDSSHEGFCALGEINARYTMAFVTGFPIHPSELHLVP